MRPTGMQSLAVHYPSVLRSNGYWLRHHRSLIDERVRGSAEKVWDAKAPGGNDGPPGSALFDATAAPYLLDPFRGTKDRRVLGPGETGLEMERRAIEKALAAAGMEPRDLDLLISVGFQPTHVGVGNAVYLAKELGLACPAINLETCCSGALVGFQTACALVSSGQYDRVMVSVSCTYSIQCEPQGILSLTSGDGAAAFQVGPAEPGSGLLGGMTVNTAHTCGAMYFESVVDEVGRPPRVRLALGKAGGKALRESPLPALRTTVAGALARAGLALADIDFFVFNTPVAWSADFYARALEIDRDKTIDTYPLYANTGPALTTGNLFHALCDRKIRKGDLVLLHSVGSISSASAAVVRWGETALGPLPEPPGSIE
jgi:3-oxoacyl-[acyl-carrier-protein] synthase III